MSDLISREQIIQKLKNRRNLFCPNQLSFSILSKDEKARVDEIDNCIADIKNLLPEGLVKTGEWIDEKINSYTSRTYCSECGSSAPFVYESDDYYGNHAHGKTAKTKFCPNCGAEMRGNDCDFEAFTSLGE